LSDPLDALSSWHADWAGLRAVVLGLGPAGFSVVDTLAELGARVTVLAAGAPEEYLDLVRVVGAEYRETAPEASADAIAELAPDLVVVTALYGPRHPAVVAALGAGVPVWSDAELAWRVRDKTGEPAEWLLVAGGGPLRADRTALLAAAMLRAAGRRVAPAGGAAPVLDAVRVPDRFETLVVELSSLQLAWTGRDRPGRPQPLASLCLDVGAEPSGWHESLDDQRAALARVYESTRVACVYNLGEEATRQMVEDAEVQDGCRAIGVGLGVPGPSELGVVEGLLVDRAFLDDRHRRALEIGTLDELALLGVRGAGPVLEVLAAAALARAAGAPPEAVQPGVAELALGGPSGG